MWTRFMDMHSGGSTKLEPYEYIYIEAPEDEAVKVFFNKFNRNPHRVSCTCCGPDYSIAEEESLEQATAYRRGCRWDGDLNRWVEEKDEEMSFKTYLTLDEYMKKDDVLFISASEINDDERTGDLPEEGYVWHGA